MNAHNSDDKRWPKLVKCGDLRNKPAIAAWGAVDLFNPSYPYNPSGGKTDTSREAGDHIRPVAAILRDGVMQYVADKGGVGTTVVEACERNGWDRFAVQPRFSELRAMRKIVDSGQRRKNPSGVNAIVWTLPGHVRAPSGGEA